MQYSINSENFKINREENKDLKNGKIHFKRIQKKKKKKRIQYYKEIWINK